MCPIRASGRIPASASAIPNPARRIGTITTGFASRLPRHVANGVSTITSASASPRNAS